MKLIYCTSKGPHTINVSAFTGMDQCNNPVPVSYSESVVSIYNFMLNLISVHIMQDFITCIIKPILRICNVIDRADFRYCKLCFAVVPFILEFF